MQTPPVSLRSTAPSGMGLLTHPQTLHFSRKHHRYAKSSISEGAVTAQAVTEGVLCGRTPSVLPLRVKPPSPRGRLFAVAIKFPA